MAAVRTLKMNRSMTTRTKQKRRSRSRRGVPGKRLLLVIVSLVAAET
jgi:hypothetical protein